MWMTEEKDGIHFPILLCILLLAARLLHQGTANAGPVEKVGMKQMVRLGSESEEIWNCVRLNRREMMRTLSICLYFGIVLSSGRSGRSSSSAIA
jgi:hypothetical protein